ncbi:MAG TPA: hypothetical protein IGS37_06355 [Synechococcales cyanobacterium M55_K2018_004]|nr:hypothetical protein [Synechococcales cyanobacterium M55_K2018_004]
MQRFFTEAFSQLAIAAIGQIDAYAVFTDDFSEDPRCAQERSFGCQVIH